MLTDIELAELRNVHNKVKEAKKPISTEINVCSMCNEQEDLYICSKHSYLYCRECIKGTQRVKRGDVQSIVFITPQICRYCDFHPLNPRHLEYAQ